MEVVKQLFIIICSWLVFITLLHRDETDAVTECRDYNFDMTALADHLRREIDQNKNAAYFNIDILKYQVWICGLIEFQSVFVLYVVSLIAGSIACSAKCRYLSYSEGSFEVFRPTGDILHPPVG